MTKKYNAYPNLRTVRRSYAHKSDRPVSRRSRLISMASLRAHRRWDLYCDRVKELELDGEVSEKLPERRLIRQNSRLLRGLRKLDYIPERRERFAETPDSEADLPEVFVPKGSQRERSFFSNYGE